MSTNQHFIPQFLIKKFAIDETEEVFLCSMKDGDIKRTKSQKIFSSSDFYEFKDTINNDIDNTLSKQEGNSAFQKSMKKLESNNINLKSHEREKVFEFYITLHNRTPFTAFQDELFLNLKLGGNILIDVPSKVIHRSIPCPFTKDARKIQKEMPDDFKKIFGTPDKTYFILLDNDTEDDFILSDNPVISFYPFEASLVEDFASFPKIYIYPLSKRKIIFSSTLFKKSIIIQASAMNEKSIFGTPNWIITTLNHLQLANAYLGVVSSCNNTKLLQDIRLFKNTLFYTHKTRDFPKIHWIRQFSDEIFDCFKEYTTTISCEDKIKWVDYILKENFRETLQYEQTTQSLNVIASILLKETN